MEIARIVESPALIDIRWPEDRKSSLLGEAVQLLRGSSAAADPARKRRTPPPSCRLGPKHLVQRKHLLGCREPSADEIDRLRLPLPKVASLGHGHDDPLAIARKRRSAQQRLAIGDRAAGHQGLL